MKLTANITLDELTKSQTAERKGIKAVDKIYDSKIGGFISQYVPNKVAKNLWR